MIENNYDRETYKKISLMLIFFTLALWVYMSYTVYYSVLGKLYSHNILNTLIIRLQGNKPNPIIGMGLVLILFSSAILTFSPTKKIDPQRKKNLGSIGVGSLICFIGLAVFQYYKDLGFIGLFLNILFFFGFFYSLLEWRKGVEEDLRKDRRNVVESQFDQKRDKIETDTSVNIPYLYMYLGKINNSWINIVNVFRAVLVGGTPGSGKSFATIEEIMRQLTKKTFTGVIYDFKFPTLSTKQYNYLTWYQNNYSIKPKFYVVNFDDPEYSHRCNPINYDSLETIADAEENTKVLMLNINKTWVDKEGDFFTDSANVFTAMLMWYLKILTKKYDYDVCSFPHLVALSTFESTEILFLMLNKYNDLKPKMKPFSEALEKGALEQLAGQVASAGVALSKISSLEINYILTGNDFTFDLNDPLAPKILCVGNNPDRQMTYSSPIGLILTKLSKSLNKQKKLPSMYVIDEFPTVYVRGIDNLIATARSNKIATVLGFQSFAQVIVNYGKEISDQMLRICGTRIMGQMMDDDAETISKNIGKQKIQTKSVTYSASDVSEAHSITLEDIVPASHISQFSQGTFCGVIADDFKYKNDTKIFVGELQPPLELKAREEDLSLPKIYDFTPDNLEELKKQFRDDNDLLISVISSVLEKRTIREWLSLIEETTSGYDFYEFIIEENRLDYFTYKPFLESLLFKKTIKDYAYDIINKTSDKTGFLDNTLSSVELHNLLENMIDGGIKERYKTNFLQSYNDDIYNDIYRLVALEIKDLNIAQELMEDRKVKATSIKFFNKIINSEKFTDAVIKERYREIKEFLEQTT